MKVILTEEQFNHIMDEASRSVPKGVLNKINAKVDPLAQELYGDKYNQPNNALNKIFNLGIGPDGRDHRVINNGRFSSGPFSLGNGKLSPDTLIINFTSAISCPSANSCPQTQAVCYAVQGEIQYPDTLKKNLAVHDLWNKALIKGKLSEVFEVAETYISSLYEKRKSGKDIYKNKVRYIRYNEAGDFPNMDYVQAAAAFSKKMRDEYGVISMAYTARLGIDFSQPLKGTNIPIDHIIKINASRVDIKRSSDVVNQQFYGIKMNFKEEITNNDKAEFVTFDNLDDLRYIPPTDEGSKNGIKSVPYLQYGKWTGGEGWYYICPCSFTLRDKARTNAKFALMGGLLNEYGVIENPTPEMINKVTESYEGEYLSKLNSKLPENLKVLCKKELNTIKSPCGIKCAVCHDMEGGIKPDGERELSYNVITATHGTGANKQNTAFTSAKQNGNDSVVYDPQNKYGVITKFGRKAFNTETGKWETPAPIRKELLKGPQDGEEVKTQIAEQKVRDVFKNMLDRINNAKF